MRRCILFADKSGFDEIKIPALWALGMFLQDPAGREEFHTANGWPVIFHHLDSRNSEVKARCIAVLDIITSDREQLPL